MRVHACGGHGNHDSAYRLCDSQSVSCDPDNNPWREDGSSLQWNKVTLREVVLVVQGNPGQPVPDFWLS